MTMVTRLLTSMSVYTFKAQKDCPVKQVMEWELS